MARCCLDFEFEGQPKWRDPEQPTTNEMMADIVEFGKKYEQLPKYAKDYCTGDFSSVMGVEFICHLNIDKAVGSQTKKGTKEVMKLIHDSINKKSSDGDKEASGTFSSDDKEGSGTFSSDDKEASGTFSSDDKEASETLSCDDKKASGTLSCGDKEAQGTYNAYKAMNYLRDLKGGFLTVQQIFDVHDILMNKLMDPEEAGKLRETVTYTNWEGLLHIYPRHQDVEDRLHAVIDRHAVYIEHLSKIENYSKKVEHVFKCAARFLFDFVDTHPFGDGNGRMCRLLANYIVNQIVPFPVALYQTDDERKNNGHTNYVNAIVQCRDNREKGPRELAAMLVESAWNGWKTFFRALDSYDHNCDKLGFFVVRASQPDDIAGNVSRILKARKSPLNEEEVTKRIVEAVNTMDVESLQDCHHLEESVEVAPQTFIVLNVFK